MEKLDQKKHANKSTSATGPRTAAGKERSKRNAVTHGIFSSVVVLTNERRSEFDSMFRDLRDGLQPNGAFEEMLVEKLADLTWRRRRLLVAEAAEIQSGADFLEWDKVELATEEAREVCKSDSNEPCLTARITNWVVLRCCLELLDELEGRIERSGFNPEEQEGTLSKLYGDSRGAIWTLFNTYRTWSYCADCSDQERKERGFPSKIGCVNKFLAALQDEKKRLIRYHEEHVRIESERTRLESLRKNVPDAAVVDRLVRYEAHLERSFDKTLTQLVHHQRMRLDQPVIPPIKVDISSS